MEMFTSINHWQNACPRLDCSFAVSLFCFVLLLTGKHRQELGGNIRRPHLQVGDFGEHQKGAAQALSASTEQVAFPASGQLK